MNVPLLLGLFLLFYPLIDYSLYRDGLPSFCGSLKYSWKKRQENKVKQK